MINSITDTITLNDGTAFPRFGLGTYKMDDGRTVEDASRWALEYGYRHIDTASFYGNEAGVGQALRDCGIQRNQMFITTKVWNADHGFDSTLRACEASLRALGLDYIDMYLMHWPGQNVDNRRRTWDAMQQLQHQQKVRAIGVSNFTPEHLNDLISATGTAPSVNQVELHPLFPQKQLRQYAADHGIAITAWGPLLHGHLAQVPEAAAIGEAYGKTAAQVILRWHLQNGICIIPKSSRQHRIRENASIFDFELSDAHMAAINALEDGTHYGADPDTMTYGFTS